ncbi:hypothetical protein IV73_GL000697 [Weissella kandleri]|uniref:Uncharacterized protein n=1 Tax=Weissella kandleri TaxID=1616 RepID=A0A0R2JCA7_9LACO|nr:hypothetical protein [Weissella kandleri]KRN74943.1 hypothetical protein IV73_GL000697 [Weissella kandleri]
MLERPVLRYHEYYPNYDGVLQQLLSAKRARGYIQLADPLNNQATHEKATKTNGHGKARKASTQPQGINLEAIVLEENAVSDKNPSHYFTKNQ